VCTGSVEPVWFDLYNPWIHTIAVTSSFFFHMFLYIIFHMKIGMAGTGGVLALGVMWFVVAGGVPLGALGFEDIGQLLYRFSCNLESGCSRLLSA